MYRTHFPFQRVLKAARQTGKTTYNFALSYLLCARYPRFTQLFVTPLYEPVRRFSSNTVAPMIDESPIKPLMVDSTCNQSVLQRTFKNRSMMYFSYAYLSVLRIRGLSLVDDPHAPRADLAEDAVVPQPLQPGRDGRPVIGGQRSGGADRKSVV